MPTAPTSEIVVETSISDIERASRSLRHRAKLLSPAATKAAKISLFLAFIVLVVLSFVLGRAPLTVAKMAMSFAASILAMYVVGQIPMFFPCRGTKYMELVWGIWSDRDFLLAAVFAHQLTERALLASPRRARTLLKAAGWYLFFPNPIVMRGDPHALDGNLCDNRRPSTGQTRKKGVQSMLYYWMIGLPANDMASIYCQVSKYIRSASRTSGHRKECNDLARAWLFTVWHSYQAFAQGNKASVPQFKSSLEHIHVLLRDSYASFNSKLYVQPKPIDRCKMIVILVLIALIVTGVGIYWAGVDKSVGPALSLLAIGVSVVVTSVNLRAKAPGGPAREDSIGKQDTPQAD